MAKIRRKGVSGYSAAFGYSAYDQADDSRWSDTFVKEVHYLNDTQFDFLYDKLTDSESEYEQDSETTYDYEKVFQSSAQQLGLM